MSLAYMRTAGTVFAVRMNTSMLLTALVGLTTDTITTDQSLVSDTLYNITHQGFLDNVTSSLDDTAGRQGKTYKDYDIYLAGLWLFRNSWMIVAPPGLLGNFIIILVTLKMKPFNSTSLFMISLAVVDVFVICLRIPFKTILMTSSAGCKAMWYLYNALPLYSNYILLFWTMERFIAVQFPLRVTEWCTVKRTAISITLAGIFSFGMSIAWPVSITVRKSGISCSLIPDMFDFILDVWYRVDTSIFVFIPMIIIFFCNIIIIFRLRQSTKRHTQMTSNEESRLKREKEQRNTTITLLAVSFAFLILHVPLAVYNCVAVSRVVLTDKQLVATWEFINFFGLVMMELQNSVNFYLYFLTGRRYRQVTVSMFVPCRKWLDSKGKGSESTTKMTGVSNSAYSD